jgi:hypothetical protein
MKFHFELKSGRYHSKRLWRKPLLAPFRRPIATRLHQVLPPMPAATTAKARKIAPYFTTEVVYPGKVGDHIQQCNYSAAGQANTSPTDYIPTDIIPYDDKFRCNLCNRIMGRASISIHIFGQRHYRAWYLQQQSVPNPLQNTSEVSQDQDRLYEHPIRFARPNAGHGPAMTWTSLPLNLPGAPQPLQALVPKPPSPPPPTHEQILNYLDYAIFCYSTPREIPIEFLTARRTLIQSM